MTFFGIDGMKFPCLEEGNRVPSQQFLKSCAHIVLFIEKMGAKFGSVRKDVDNNVKKLTAKYQQDPGRYKTINDILEDPNWKTDKVLRSAQQGCVWLLRGLNFVQLILKNLVEDFEEKQEQTLSAIASDAYTKSLHQYHNAIVRGLVWGILKFAPSKESLMERLQGSEPTTDEQVAQTTGDEVQRTEQKGDEKVIADMKAFGPTLQENITVLQDLCVKLQIKE